MTSRSVRCLWLVGLCACHTYTPAPVDIDAHAAAFFARRPDATHLREVLGDAPGDAIASRIVLDDGLDRSEARLVAAVLHPECRLARQRVATAAAAREHAGVLPDPELQLGLERILESMPHQWLASASLGLVLPINGRLAAERSLADAGFAASLVALRLAEEHAAAAADRAWVRWSAQSLRAARLRELQGGIAALEAIARRLAEAGANTALDARQFTLERLRREAELARAEAALRVAAIERNAALGLPPHAELACTPELLRAPALPEADVRRAALLRGPRLAEAAAQHAVAERDLALQIKKQWPDLVLAPGWAEEDGQPRATLGLSLPLPVFAGNDAQIAAAAAVRDERAAAWRIAFERAAQELAVAEEHLTIAQQQRTFVTASLLPLAAQQLEDGRRLAELGTLDPFLLLDALLREHEAHGAAIDAAADEALAAVTLDTFTWQEPLARAIAGESR